MKLKEKHLKTVHILYPAKYDADSWSKKNALGLEPDKYPYGFNRLENHGFKITFGNFPRSYFIKNIGNLISKFMPFYFDLYYLIFQLRHFLYADILINALDKEGFTLCWLRKHKIFGLHKKMHIFIPTWLPSYVQTCSQNKLKKYRELLSTVDVCMYYYEGEKNILQEYLSIPDEKLERIYFGVDADFYTPEETQVENFILAPGNDSHRDFKILSDVFKALPDERLYIASKMRIKDSEPPPNISYLNLNYNRELLDYYRRAKIILIPIIKDCSCSSGLTVLMESMLLCKPVIATATVQNKEINKDEELALLVEPSNPKEIVEAIKSLNSDHVRRNKIIEAARAYAIKYFTSEYCMQRLAGVIKRLLARTPRTIVHVILPYQFRINEWIDKNATGLVPGRMQYDLLRLNDFGVNVTYSEAPYNTFFKLLSKISRFLLGFSLIHYIYQIRPARKADLIFTKLDPDGIVICVMRKLKLFGLQNKPQIFKVNWLPDYLENTKGIKLRWLISSLSTVDLFLVGTPYIKRTIQKYVNIPDSRFSFNAHGIDCGFFTPTQLQNDNFILCVGNDSHRDFAVLNELQKKLNGSVNIMVATELRNKDFKIQESARLHIVHLSHIELRDYYNRAQFVIIPVKKGCLTDSGITTLKEAMCMGKAVIASATDAMKELVDDGENAFLVQPGDADDMARKINYLLDNPEACKKLGFEAYRRREDFSTEEQLKKLSNDISNLINHRTSTTRTAFR